MAENSPKELFFCSLCDIISLKIFLGVIMKTTATFFAIIAAALYAINIPFSKLLLNYVPPTMMAAFLYLGAGVGMAIYGLVMKLFKKNNKKSL